jgi:hypothetical protein
VKLTDSDERTPTAEPMGRCPRCQRPTTLCDGHPTAEPVTPMRDDDAGCWKHGDESITTRIEPAERVIEHCTICGKDVGWTWQAAQRSTAERPWKEWFEGCQQARAEADAKLITLRAEVERLYTRLVVDGNDVDVNAYHNDPIYKGIVYRIHRGTPRAALAAALVEKENPDER